MKTRTEIDCRNGITLETLKAVDAPALAQLANNRAIWRNLRDAFPHPYGLADAVSFLDMIENDFPGLALGIYVHGQFAGTAGVIPQTDIHRLSGEIGYWLGQPYWGRGIATVAVGQLVRHTFETTALIRLFAGIFAYNKPSMRVLEKNGFTLDLIQKAAVYKDGKVWDEHRYSLVDDSKLAPLLP